MFANKNNAGTPCAGEAMIIGLYVLESRIPPQTADTHTEL